MPAMRIVPTLLIVFRLLLGPALIALALGGVRGFVFLPLLAAGSLSDIFDGIIARRLGVDTPRLRRLDSLADLFFYLCVLVVAALVNGETLRAGLPWILGILALEVACIALSLVRFSRMPATHSYLAKGYGLALVVTFVALIAFEETSPLWWAGLFTVALVANTEVLLIIGLARTPPIDVASVFVLRRRERDPGPS